MIGDGLVQLQFQDTLVQAVFLTRLNRFVLECELPSGTKEKVHLPDPGRLKDLLVSGSPIWLQESTDPKRKTKWSAVMTYDPSADIYVSLNTHYPNRLVHEALQLAMLEELNEWQLERAEFKVGRSRFDFLLTHKQNDQKLLLEVKSVTMVEDGIGKFPDAVTARGARHVEELTHLQVDGKLSNGCHVHCSAYRFARDHVGTWKSIPILPVSWKMRLVRVSDFSEETAW